jgi:hypothetical protein
MDSKHNSKAFQTVLSKASIIKRNETYLIVVVEFLAKENLPLSIHEGIIPENLFSPRSKDTKLRNVFRENGKHPVKLFFARCTDFSAEERFVKVGSSPTNALLDKSMYIRDKFHKHPGSTPEKRLFDESKDLRIPS